MDSLIADLNSPDQAIRDNTLVQLEVATRNAAIPDDAREPILWMMESEEHWAVRLHLVRILPRVQWPAEEYGKVVAYLFEHANGKNKFVAAWALYSLATLAVKDAELKQRVLPLLTSTMETGSAAIRVRARHGLELLS